MCTIFTKTEAPSTYYVWPVGRLNAKSHTAVFNILFFIALFRKSLHSMFTQRSPTLYTGYRKVFSDS